MAFSIARFWFKGWIHDLYVDPSFHFTWFGFDFIQPLPEAGMYMVFFLLFLAAICIALGAAFRIASISFFVLFTYVELLDKAPYLNHYYFVSIIALLLCFTSANKRLSIDSLITSDKITHIPAYQVYMFIIQLALVYLFAGVAKLNSAWLLDAMPMKIWLPARADAPLIGSFLRLEETAYLFSWMGAFYDLIIVFFLMASRTRKWAYAAVVIFHVMTWYLFQIGMFPWIMIGLTLVFFPPSAHERFWKRFERNNGTVALDIPVTPKRIVSRTFVAFLSIHFFVQLMLPLRSHWLSDNVFWDEAGYRFSWRVMLMEKAGYIHFTVVDPSSGKRKLVEPSAHLTQLQEIQMSTQPDMILQYAAFLKVEAELAGIESPEIYAESFVSLNGKGSQRFVNPAIDLTTISPATNRMEWLVSPDNLLVQE